MTLNTATLANAIAIRDSITNKTSAAYTIAADAAREASFAIARERLLTASTIVDIIDAIASMSYYEFCKIATIDIGVNNDDTFAFYANDGKVIVDNDYTVIVNNNSIVLDIFRTRFRGSGNPNAVEVADDVTHMWRFTRTDEYRVTTIFDGLVITADESVIC